MIHDVNIKNGVTLLVYASAGKVCIRAKWLIRPALISGFCSMKRLGVFLLPPG